MNWKKIKSTVSRMVMSGLALVVLGGCHPKEDITFLLRDGQEHKTGTAQLQAAVDIQDVRVNWEAGARRFEVVLPWGAGFAAGDVFTYELRFRADAWSAEPNLLLTWRIDGDGYPGSDKIAEAFLLDVDTGSIMANSEVRFIRASSEVTLETTFSEADLRERTLFDANGYMKPRNISWDDAGPVGVLAASFEAEGARRSGRVNNYYSTTPIDKQTMVEDSVLTEFYNNNVFFINHVTTPAVPPAEAEERVPDLFGWRAVRFPYGVTCPPDPGTVEKMDLDNRKKLEEGKYKRSEDKLDNLVEGKITALLYFLGAPPEEATGADSYFSPILVVDENKDGIANKEEICAASTDVVGQCVYPRGRNSWHFNRTSLKLRWISRDYGSLGDPFRFTGKWKMFEYDTTNGNLKVVEMTTNYSYDPEKPEPDPNTTVPTEDGGTRPISREQDPDLNWKLLRETTETTADKYFSHLRLNGSGCR